jgi:hypothetical protein
MMCEACERDDHANCGLQTWCECECDGQSPPRYPENPDNHVRRSFRVQVEPDGSIDADKLAALLLEAQNPETATAKEFTEALREIPSGKYLCGCDWSGGIIPHFCPTHHQPPVFVIQGDPNERR